MSKEEHNQKEFIEKLFITCPNCGYNNYKTKIKIFGACLKCGKILDGQSYFRYKMMGRLGTIAKRKIK